MKPRALILTGAGINADRELAEAFALAGADPRSVHLFDLGENPRLIFDHQILALPGGFSYGDHLGSGRLLAGFLRHRLGEALGEVVARGLPVLGICNGFQVLVKAGLLPMSRGRIEQEASLVHNDSGRFEDRWVEIGVEARAARRSPWLTGLATLRCPVRHGEGKLVGSSPAAMDALEKAGHIAFRYLEAGQPATNYPANPNGSWHSAAGFLDASGLILGLMPHPEAALYNLQRPDWTRHGGGEGTTDCLRLFSNIVKALG